MIAKLLIGIATLNYAIAPLFADLNSTHVFHAEWSARSRLPTVWLFRASSTITAVALWLTWQRGRELPAGIVGLCVVGIPDRRQHPRSVRRGAHRLRPSRPDSMNPHSQGKNE